MVTTLSTHMVMIGVNHHSWWPQMVTTLSTYMVLIGVFLVATIIILGGHRW